MATLADSPMPGQWPGDSSDGDDDRPSKNTANNDEHVDHPQHETEVINIQEIPPGGYSPFQTTVEDYTSENADKDDDGLFVDDTDPAYHHQVEYEDPLVQITPEAKWRNHAVRFDGGDQSEDPYIQFESHTADEHATGDGDELAGDPIFQGLSQEYQAHGPHTGGPPVQYHQGLPTAGQYSPTYHGQQSPGSYQRTHHADQYPSPHGPAQYQHPVPPPHPYDPGYHRRPPSPHLYRPGYAHGPVQIVDSSHRAPREKDPSPGEQMQMMMMNQMMMQQMQSQQMQAAQMAAMISGAQSGQNGQSGGRHQRDAKGRKPSIKIKSKKVNTRGRNLPPIAPVVIQPVTGYPVGSTIESAAMDNWQEATIILCLALVALIYLVTSRSSKPEDKTSLAAKHLAPKK